MDDEYTTPDTGASKKPYVPITQAEREARVRLLQQQAAMLLREEREEKGEQHEP